MSSPVTSLFLFLLIKAEAIRGEILSGVQVSQACNTKMQNSQLMGSHVIVTAFNKESLLHFVIRKNNCICTVVLM
jgi:hypothetical protein